MTTTTPPDILCIGAVLWDTIGRVDTRFSPGADLPGRITRLPGGVAFNIAAALRSLGLRPALLSVVGDDSAGDELVAECERRGLDMAHVYRAPGTATDRYLAIEDAHGLVAAIADVHTLELAGPKILAPLYDGRLGSATKPWSGLIVLDGNLTESVFAEIAASPLFASADLRLAPASSGKVTRLRPFVAHPQATFYLNRVEAGLLCACEFADAIVAAESLVAQGVRHAVVTDGAKPCADAKRGEPTLSLHPPVVRVRRVTGAGDTFMAAHIAAGTTGAAREQTLSSALAAASRYVMGEIGS